MLVLLTSLGVRYFWTSPALAYRVDIRPVTWTLSGPGILDATDRVVVTARLSGRLTWIGVDRNDPVVAGQTVARLQDQDLESSREAARADFEAATRGVEQAKLARVRAAAGLEKLKLDLDRRRRLIVTGSVSHADLDAAEYALKQAQAEVDGADVAIDRATAQARSAEAAVALAQARFDDVTLRSPLNGLVVTRERNVGDILLVGSPVMQVVAPSSVIVSARFDESIMGALSVGQATRIQFASVPDRSFDGKVIRIARQVDQETREFLVDISLDSLPTNWALGQRTKVQIDIRSSSKLPLLPLRFVRREDGKPVVWVLVGGHASWRQVVLRHSIGPLVEIEHGLAENDIVLDPTGRYSYQPISPNFNEP